MRTPLPVLRPLVLVVALPLAVLAFVHVLAPAPAVPAAAAPAPAEPSVRAPDGAPPRPGPQRGAEPGDAGR